jgi:hypothetical protein
VGIAEWLEEWVAARKAHPDPLPPEDWHLPTFDRNNRGDPNQTHRDVP